MFTDIIKIGQIILQAGSSAALIGLLVTLAVPSLKKKIFGNGENAHKLADDVAELLATNHFSHIIDNSNESILLLKQILEETKEHNRSESPILQNISEKLTYLQAKQNGK